MGDIFFQDEVVSAVYARLRASCGESRTDTHGSADPFSLSLNKIHDCAPSLTYSSTVHGVPNAYARHEFLCDDVVTMLREGRVPERLFLDLVHMTENRYVEDSISVQGPQAALTIARKKDRLMLYSLEDNSQDPYESSSWLLEPCALDVTSWNVADICERTKYFFRGYLPPLHNISRSR
ncbi:hypothetical protein GF342_03970 [Candidatus Woesearchaeota archaeon]|nr:hypothetical protein [Candidatus Woesearchaeota archaeon]